ncbi:MAG: NAD(P)-dependent oxidoreductase, partial [Gemmatimonadota bacterium]
MRVLLTGAATELGRLLAAGLRADHHLRLSDAADLVTDLEFARCGLGHDEATDHLVAGIEAIVYPVPAHPAGAPATEWLDASTRCTYNLLLAAAEAGVRRVVVLSTLDILRAYDPDLAVAEDWRPRPTCEADELGPHLAEMVAREFAHSGRLEVVVLRLGHLVEAEAARRLPYDPMWVDGRDVVGAVRVALEQPLARFTVS